MNSMTVEHSDREIYIYIITYVHIHVTLYTTICTLKRKVLLFLNYKWF